MFEKRNAKSSLTICPFLLPAMEVADCSHIGDQDFNGSSGVPTDKQGGDGHLSKGSSI
jgi:hypothetical protein